MYAFGIITIVDNQKSMIDSVLRVLVRTILIKISLCFLMMSTLQFEF